MQLEHMGPKQNKDNFLFNGSVEFGNKIFMKSDKVLEKSTSWNLIITFLNSLKYSTPLLATVSANFLTLLTALK